MAAALDVAVDYESRLENDRELGDFNQGVKSSIHDSINQNPINNISILSPPLSKSSKSVNPTQTYNWIKFKRNPFPRHNTTEQNRTEHKNPHPFLFFFPIQGV